MSEKIKSGILETQVLIIGGGVTGTGLARDLALRGLNTILVERKDINAGASGANHGLLHSGARYIAIDSEAAKECREENDILKHIAPHCIEDTGGLFIAVEGDDESYIADFPDMCVKCGISTQAMHIKDVLEMEPVLSDKVIAAYFVNDASIDPFRISLENISHAKLLGSQYLKDMEVIEFDYNKGKIHSTVVRNKHTGEKITIKADIIVNASGAWTNHVAMLANIPISTIYSKGTLLVTNTRLAFRVINRLRKAADCDIMVPGGTASILGTTSIRISSPDETNTTVKEVNQIVEGLAQMVPMAETARYIRAFSGVRPLVSTQSEEDDRQVSRGFVLIDHKENGIENFITITGGKLTTYRLMAEKTGDLVCKRLSMSTPCKTRTEPLPATQYGKWTIPGTAPKIWSVECDANDAIICECEMVPKSAINEIISSIEEHKGLLSLKAIGLRSRLGKGPCQGTFCSVRLAAYLYDQCKLESDKGIFQLKDFLNERWLGQHVLFWDLPLIQSELMEAIHCGLFNIEIASKL